MSAVHYDPGSSEVNRLARLKLLLAKAAAGRHPDENDDGFIVGKDGALIKPEIRLAEGSTALTDTEPVSLSSMPAAGTE